MGYQPYEGYTITKTDRKDCFTNFKIASTLRSQNVQAEKGHWRLFMKNYNSSNLSGRPHKHSDRFPNSSWRLTTSREWPKRLRSWLLSLSNVTHRPPKNSWTTNIIKQSVRILVDEEQAPKSWKGQITRDHIEHDVTATGSSKLNHTLTNLKVY